MKLKVITLNVWLFRFFDKIVDFLEKEKPDIVLLQEATSGTDQIFDRGLTNGVERLREVFPEYESVFHPIRTYQYDNFKMWMGCMILSRYPILSTNAHYYYEQLETVTNNNYNNTNFPGLLLTAKLNGIDLQVHTTHFLWSMHPDITDRQRGAVKNLLGLLEKNNRCIIGGDFNITDDSEIYKTLSRSLISDRPTDVKRTLHPEIHPIGTSKNLAVDFIFHKGKSIIKLESYVPEVPVSDHLPVVATYEITSS